MNEKHEKAFISIVKTIGNLSTCARVKVGAILVKEGRIVATSWNGVPSGHTHCAELFANADMSDPEIKEKHHEFAVNNELHAEQNLIAYCARNGIDTDDTTMYITVSPCSQCAKLIIAAGIKEVKYIEEYDRDIGGVIFLKKSGVNVHHIGD